MNIFKVNSVALTILLLLIDDAVLDEVNRKHVKHNLFYFNYSVNYFQI